mmetsp:Transcript_22310/g.66119  ORF Transcript_22310/g.66119 Transcript_22310/m.66119 type:complete len:268 (-) Transcript_22310:1029-1832(-)
MAAASIFLSSITPCFCCHSSRRMPFSLSPSPRISPYSCAHMHACCRHGPTFSPDDSGVSHGAISEAKVQAEQAGSRAKSSPVQSVASSNYLASGAFQRTSEKVRQHSGARPHFRVQLPALPHGLDQNPNVRIRLGLGQDALRQTQQRAVSGHPLGRRFIYFRPFLESLAAAKDSAVGLGQSREEKVEYRSEGINVDLFREGKRRLPRMVDLLRSLKGGKTTCIDVKWAHARRRGIKNGVFRLSRKEALPVTEATKTTPESLLVALLP